MKTTLLIAALAGLLLLPHAQAEGFHGHRWARMHTDKKHDPLRDVSDLCHLCESVANLPGYR